MILCNFCPIEDLIMRKSLKQDKITMNETQQKPDFCNPMRISREKLANVTESWQVPIVSCNFD